MSIDEQTMLSLSESKNGLIGTILQGNYLVQELVGTGGMAIVYKAQHTKFHESFAIKVLHPQIRHEPEAYNRLMEEAKIQFRLKHPHIVRVTDVLETLEDVGLVMEWINGDNLWNHTKEFGPLSRKDIWRIAAPLLEALQYAHQQGVIHRDIKPGNILLHEQGSKLVPKIADFGVARVLDELKERQTQTGMTMGTLRFMPPEQIMDSKSVDLRADIYAFGATLYFMGTNRLPFQGKREEVIFQHLRQMPTPPSHHNPMLSRAFDQVLLRCMAKLPDDRYQSCAELSHALSKALLGMESMDDADTQVANPAQLLHMLHGLPEDNSVYSGSIDMIVPAFGPGAYIPSEFPLPMEDLPSAAPSVMTRTPTEVPLPQEEALSEWGSPTRPLHRSQPLPSTPTRPLQAQSDHAPTQVQHYQDSNAPRRNDRSHGSSPYNSELNTPYTPPAYHPAPALAPTRTPAPPHTVQPHSAPSHNPVSHTAQAYNPQPHQAPPHNAQAHNPPRTASVGQTPLPHPDMSHHSPRHTALPASTRRLIVVLVVACTLMFGALAIGLFLMFQSKEKPIGQPPPITRLTPQPVLRPLSTDKRCTPGQRAPCFDGPLKATNQGRCKSGFKACDKQSRWGPCQGQILPAKQELCNGIDDNCDGKIDESFPKKGKRCRIKQFQCDFAGRYVCTRNQRALSCRNTGAAYQRGTANIRITLAPVDPHFQLVFNGVHKSAQRRYCVGVRGQTMLQIKHEAYHTCLFPLPQTTSSIRVTLNLRADSLDPPLGCCRK